MALFGRKKKSVTPIINSTLQVTGDFANKGIDAFAKQNADVSEIVTRNMSSMEFEQRMNYDLADLARSGRRIHRIAQYCDREATVVELVRDWIVDQSLFVRDIIWGFIGPIISTALWLIFRIVFVIFVNVMVIGVIYLLFFM